MISIVIPAFNEEQLLPQCLKSLQNQDYTGDYEIIVADNGSTDDTRKIARQFGARVISCSRKGPIYARQAGASAACGDIIVQADADTLYPEDWLSRIARHFSTHPESAALAGRYVYRSDPYWAKLEYFLRHTANLLCLLFLRNAGCVSGANFAFRREAFLKVNGYNPRALSPDQWGIAHRLSKASKVSYDKNLVVVTSRRRVQKPFGIIVWEFTANVSRVLLYFLKYCFGLGKTSTKTFALKKKPIRIPIKFITSILLASIICLLVYGYVSPSAQVFGKIYYKSRTTEKVAALTFDDGPNEPYTSEILDILDSYGIKATFFVIGQNVESYPGTALQIVNEGHIIGNHTYDHNANHALMRKRGFNSIRQAQEVIYKTVGVKPHLYRPPHGKKSPWEINYIKKENLVEVTWNVAANDQFDIERLARPTPEEFAKEIVKEVKPGSIILLHDGYGTDHNTIKSDRSLTVGALPIIIEELQSRGYRFATIPELLGIPAYN